MPSPFPGMNPYFEKDSVWEEFHTAMILYARDQLVPQLRPNFVVNIEAQVYLLQATGRRELLAEADLAAARTDPAEAEPGNGGVAVATEAAPATGTLPRLRQRRVRGRRLVIRNRESQEVVTVLELLSPWNKLASQDRRRYLAKRQRLLASPVHLVEIDLLRGRGARMPVRGLPPCDYCALVSRAAARPTVGLWPVRLADRLPVLPVPLRAPAADAKLDLQALVHQIYDAGGYADYLYRRPPRPRLTPEQLAWAQAFLPGGTPPGPTAATPAP